MADDRHDIVVDAKEWLKERESRKQTHSAACHQWHIECLVARLVHRIEKLEQNNKNIVP
jgi:hypothetical protein